MLDTLFRALRESNFLNVPLWEAKKLGLTPAALRQLAEGSPELEIVRIAGGSFKPFDAVRAVLTPENLARLAPVSVERLRKAYARDPEGTRRLEEVLAAGGENGPFHVAENEVRSGPGASTGVQIAAPRGFMPDRVAVEERGEWKDEDLRVLSHLEDLEEERINFGLYDTFVSADEIRARIAAREPGIPAADPAELAAALERLVRHRFVLPLAEGRYRSRISETVRVLKRVKQRFGANDMTTAPYLVHSIRVRFQDRRRLARNKYLSGALQRVFEQNLGEGSRIDGARMAVERGFAVSVGEPPAKVTITAVQERALEFIAGKYLSQQGQGVVITGNTGSGKTEAALLPLLLGAVEEKLRGVEGCKVLLVYPRQELAKNQLQRLSEYLARINRELEGGEIRGGPRGVLTAGIVFGGTPTDDGDLVRGSKHRKAWTQEGNGYVLPYFTNEADGPVVLTALDHGIGVLRSTPAGFDDDGGWELEGFRATRQAVLKSPPDVLVITTEMLHRWLMEPGASPLFGLPAPGKKAAEFAPPRAIVFDEIHLYDTIHGAQIGMLLRRLRHRIGVALQVDRADEWAFPLVIGMSATIGTPLAFWSRLSGLPTDLVAEFSPNQEQDLEAAQGREYFLFIRPETYSRGRHVGDAAAAIQSIMAVAHNMVRRGPAGDQPPKHRSLVFQDSISKVKKLTIEFRDAESNRFLAQYRLERPADEAAARAVFAEGDYWLFDAEDPFQYGQNRTDHGDPPCALTSDASPVFSGSKGTDRLKHDIVFATSVLEVGYDDPSIQFVFQHHAPRNAASFVQKKGRAGRSLQDRPITGVTLSRGSYRDAFFYQNPRLLYDPADYRPPLNVDNYFVQRFQALALLFDELVRLTGRDFASLPPRIPEPDLDARLEELDRAVRHHEAQLQHAFAAVTGEAFRRVHPALLEVWEWFLRDFQDREVRFGVRLARNLLRGHPDLPENLFSTLNLPTLRVMYREQGGREEGKWKFAEEDVALAFWEVAPGKVTRRYGRGHALYWRAPGSFRPWRLAVAIERTKQRKGEPDGPFDPTRVKSLPAEWGADWASLLPVSVQRLYGGTAPERFYRARFVELWNFGTLNPRDPRRPRPDWRWWGKLLPDGSVRLSMADEGKGLPNPWRRVSPDSTSYPLSCAVGGALRSENGVSPSSDMLQLPPLFPGLLEELHVFAGEVGGQRSALAVWEVHYAAEARVILLPGPRGKDDPYAGTGTNLVRYESEHDHEPTLYGYDLTTEGLRIPFNEERLAEVADSLFTELWNDEDRQRHLQDQYLRYLLKSEKWPLEGADPALNAFDLRTVADLISTMRAETRIQGVAKPADFLARLTDAGELRVLVEDMRARYWRDHRVLNDAFVERLEASLTLPGVDRFLTEIFHRIGKEASVKEYLQGVVLHSLKHAVRHLFVTEGSTRDEEVGSFGLFRRLTHPDWSPGRDFYVYERNQDGSGATRLVSDVERVRGIDHLVRRWWDVSLACPVGDEEDFFRAALLRHGDELHGFASEFLNASVEARRSPKEFLLGLFPDVLGEDEPLLGHLAGVLTSELSLGGEKGIPMIDLHAEVYELERELARRFGRPPTQGELAGYAASAVESDAEPRRYPALGRLRDLYRRHAATMQAHDDEGTANELDRFLDQVGHLSLRTCVDACPACLASNCHLGHIETMRHALSRRYLKEVHRILSAPSTVEYQPGTTVEDLVQASAATGGWVILVYHERLPEPLVRAIRDRFDNVARIFDHERIELRRILHLREDG